MGHKEALAKGEMLNAETRAHRHAERTGATQAAQHGMNVQNAPAEMDPNQRAFEVSPPVDTLPAIPDRNVAGESGMDPRDAVNNPDRVNKMIDAIWDKL
jgi:hypothetical protein